MMHNLRSVASAIALLSSLVLAPPVSANDHATKPNILFFFVDDWGRNASIYADPEKRSLNSVIKTPNFDRIGREGVLFNNAFMHVSSCGPSRSSLTTGRYFWNCGSGAFLNGGASDWKGHENPLTTMTKFPDLLRESGYYTRKAVKTIAFDESKPGLGGKEVPTTEYQRYGLYVSEAKDDADRTKRIEETLNHPRYEMRRVLKGREPGQPFFFIYGTINVHRPYTADSGRKLWGIQPESLKGLIPKFLPDVEDVWRDFSDYLGEVQAADAMLGVMLNELEAAGELDNTLIICTGDNGMPGVPRGKTNCYDLSVRAPIMVRYPKQIQAGRRVDDFVSVMDIGPTLLEAAGLPVPKDMVARSFLPQLESKQSGWIDEKRDWVVVGRELHYHSARDGNLPYPMRAIRTKDHLYIHNFKSDRWPNGAPYNLDDKSKADDYAQLDGAPYRDLDASLTKTWLIDNRSATDAKEDLELTLGNRPPEELYDIHADPDSLHNLANDPVASAVKTALSQKLLAIEEASQDPRLTDDFDKPPYVVDPSTVAPRQPKARRKKKAE